MDPIRIRRQGVADLRCFSWQQPRSRSRLSVSRPCRIAWFCLAVVALCTLSGGCQGLRWWPHAPAFLASEVGRSLGVSDAVYSSSNSRPVRHAGSVDIVLETPVVEETFGHGAIAAACAVVLAGLLYAVSLPRACATPLQYFEQMQDTAEASPQFPPELRDKSSERALRLGKALVERKAIMFGTYWCPFCDKERQALGRDVISPASSGSEGKDGYVRYVECDPRGYDARPDLCRAAGVKAFPSWALASSPPDEKQPFQLYRGAKGLDGLEQIVGLPSPVDPDAVAPPITSNSGPRELAMAKKLTDQGWTMYGTYWCRFCDQQRQLFGKEAWNAIRYVECDGRCAGAEPLKCDAADVTGFPEWVAPSGRHVGGVITLDQFDALLADQASSKVATVLPAPEACEDCKIGEGVRRAQ